MKQVKEIKKPGTYLLAAKYPRGKYSNFAVIRVSRIVNKHSTKRQQPYNTIVRPTYWNKDIKETLAAQPWLENNDDFPSNGALVPLSVFLKYYIGGLDMFSAMVYHPGLPSTQKFVIYDLKDRYQ